MNLTDDTTPMMTGQGLLIHDEAFSFSSRTGAELVQTTTQLFWEGKIYQLPWLVGQQWEPKPEAPLFPFPPSPPLHLALQTVSDDPPLASLLFHVVVSSSPAAAVPPQE